MLSSAIVKPSALQDWAQKNVLLVLFVVLCIALGIAFPTFFTANNWILILQSSVIVGVMAIGALVRHDQRRPSTLSFAATMLFCGAVAARFMVGDAPSTPLALIVAPPGGRRDRARQRGDRRLQRDLPASRHH